MQVFGELQVQKRFLEVHGLRVVDCPLHQLLLETGIRLQVQNEGVRRQQLHGVVIVELGDAAAGIVEEMVIAVNSLSLLDEFDDVAHGADLGFAVQGLTLLEFLNR